MTSTDSMIQRILLDSIVFVQMEAEQSSRLLSTHIRLLCTTYHLEDIIQKNYNHDHHDIILNNRSSGLLRNF